MTSKIRNIQQAFKIIINRDLLEELLLYVFSSACCFQLGQKWKSGREGVLELGNPGGRGVIAVREIQLGGGGVKNAYHPSGGGGVYFFWNNPFALVLLYITR